jgi:phosphoglycerate dehydrogenase-like enzyme
VSKDRAQAHVPLTPETANLIDEYALADRPAAGTLFASALDTSSGEPLDERSRLRQLSKSIITPHVGAPRPSRSSRPRWRPRAITGYLSDPAGYRAHCVNPAAFAHG